MARGEEFEMMIGFNMGAFFSQTCDHHGCYGVHFGTFRIDKPVILITVFGPETKRPHIKLGQVNCKIIPLLDELNPSNVTVRENCNCHFLQTQLCGDLESKQTFC